MTTWRFFTADIITGTVFDEVALSDVKFRLELNKPGSLTASISLGEDMATSSTTRATRSNITIAATYPARTALYAERDGVIVWAGIIWDRRYSRRARKIALSAGTFESYYAHRRLETEWEFTNADQLDIMRTLAEACRDVDPAGDIGISIPVTDNGINVASSGVARDRHYLWAENKKFSEIFDQLATISDGFDWAIDVTWDAGTIVRNLNLSYPRRGRNFSESGFVFDSDRNLIDYDVREFGSKMANRYFGVGAGDGLAALVSTAIRWDSIDIDGYPLFDGLYVDKSVAVQETLDGKTTRLVDDYSYPPTELGLTVLGDVDPTIGEWVIGDDVRVIIRPDERFPDGLDSYYRILAADFTVDGNGAETIDLTVTEAV